MPTSFLRLFRNALSAAKKYSWGATQVDFYAPKEVPLGCEAIRN